MDNNTLIASWNSWVANAPSNEWQGRQQAASILVGYLNHPDGNLHLDGLGLTSLPDHFPDSVKSLSVNDNHLTALPETLPDGIREIEVNNNLLTALPKHLPGSLASLDCENNLLKGLPDNLPDGLIRLNVSNNSLKTLPNTLPASLELLFADGNQLTALPIFSDTLISSLVSLDLSNNQLTTVPDNLTKMTADDAMVRLTGNPLLPQSVSDLQSITLAPNYKGPAFDLKGFWYTDKYKVAWGQWVDNAPNEPERAVRLKAVEALHAVAMNESVALDLSHLGLTSLPELLPPCLKVLNVSGNQLTQLPENLPGGLTALEAGGNLLTTLPTKLPEGLEELNVGNNKLIAIPDGSLPDLITDLKLTGNLLTVIPDVLPDDLKKLFIGYNQINSLPESFLYRLHQYTIVDLRGNKLTGFPREFLNVMDRCLTLDLGDNPMSDDSLNELARVINDKSYYGPEVTLPLTTTDQKILAAWEKWASEAPDATETLGRNKAVDRVRKAISDHLIMLDLGSLGLTSLPDEFPSAMHLLNLENNKLTELPDALPAELISIDVSNNKLTTLPEDLPDNLKTLAVRNNMLTSLPGYDDSFFSGLSLLNLSGNKLTTVPDNLVLAKGKAALYLDNNPLPDSVITMLRQANYIPGDMQAFVLPQTTTEKMLYAEWKKWVDSAPTPDEKISRQAAVRQLTSCLEKGLTSLDLSNGDLTSLPDAFPPELTQIVISHNRLTTLPENLPGKLFYLDAAENDISSITTHLPDSLTALDLSNNRLSALPDVLPTGLTSLFAMGNHIAVLPAFSDAFLSSLVSLNLSGNNITTLPDSLINLRNRISRIDLSGNPLSDDIILAVRQRYLALEPDLPTYKLPLLSKEKAYKTTLQQWVQNSPTALEKIVRGAAMDRIMDCLLYNKTKLDLSSLNLPTLPDELPPQLTHLDISGNQLTTLPDLLPAGLKKLYAEHNLIRVLPTSLPPGLQVMNFCDNEITSLPAWSSAFVSSIDALDVSENRLTSIPLNLLQDFNNSATLSIELNNFSSAVIDQMRAVVTNSHYHGAFIDIFKQDYLQTYADLWTNWVNAAVDPTEKTVRIYVSNELEAVFAHDETDLNLSGLDLTSLADRLPPTLTSLDVSDNKLTELPEHLPGGLKSLYANNNTLSKLPDNLSSRLTHLEVNNNKLVTLPDHLPDGLKDLSVRDNLLTRLPLPSDLPTVSWFRADGNRQPLSVAVTAWFAGDPDSVTAQWQSLDSEGNSIFLGDLLVRLLWTKNGKSAGFKTLVAAWLEQLLADPALQESAFAQASEAFDTCDDKALLVFNTLQDESLTQAITTGQLDTRLPALLSVAREIFRRQALDRIAKAKADLLFPAGDTDNAEHVEVYLGYQVALKQRLGLTHTIDDMNYFTSSHLTQADLDAAEAEVKSQESTQFSSWLAHWAPWQGVLERFDADAFDDARENLIEKLDETAPRVNIEYLRRGYTGSNDATITPAVKKEVESLVEQQLYEECYGPIATQLFTDAGLVHLLDDPWVAHGANGGGMPTIQRLLDLNNLLQSGLHNLADIVSQQQTDGIHVLFAPQSFLLGDDAERGICDSLSEAWLYTLAQEDNGSLRTALLDNVFLRSQYLVADAAAAGRVTGSLSDDMQAFLDTLSALDTTGPRTIQSLSEVVHQLASASVDIYLSLYTGNHALALARRTQGNTTAFWLYDPNFGEVMLPVSGAQDDGSALTSLINNVLGMKAGDGQETLADYYQTERQNGDYSFTVRTVNTASLPTRPDLQALQAQLQKAVVPDVPLIATTEEELSPELESLRQSVQTKLSAVLSVDIRQTVKQTADDTARRLWDKIRQAATSDAGGLKITGVDVMPAKDPLQDDVVLKLTGTAADGSQHETTVTISKDELVIAEPDIQGALSLDEVSYARGYDAFLKSLGLYSLLTSLTGLITAASQGDVKGEAISGTFAAMTVSDITGLVDKLVDRFVQWAGITGTEAFGGGLAGLIGKGASELGLLVGLGGAAASTVGRLMADVPLLQAGALGFTLYSDIMVLENAPIDSPEYMKALGMVSVDTVVGVTVLTIGGLVLFDVLASIEGGGLGTIIAVAGIVIDVIIQEDNPLGLRGATNPGSIKMENYLKKENYLYAGAKELYCIRTLPADAAGQTQQVLSFIIGARTLPAVQTLLEDKMTLSLQQYLAGLKADTLKTYGNDTSALIEGMTTYLTTALAAAQRQAVSEGKFTEGEQIQSQINTIPATLAQWRPLLDSARSAITDKFVSDDNVLSYIINPDFPLPVSAYNGDLVVEMNSDGRGFKMGWTTPYGSDDMEDNPAAMATGPERFKPDSVYTIPAVSGVIMGMGQTVTTSFRDYYEGDITLGVWDEGFPPSDKTGVDYKYPVTWDLDPEGSVYADSVKLTLLNHRFSITGSDLDTEYYSQWSDPDYGYDYIINGGKGDDTLFLGGSGQYTFNGGGGTNSVVAFAKKRADADYSVFDLQPARSPVSTEKYSLYKNFSLSMSGVVNIQGSDNNEIFHGDDRSNIIQTGGGNNVIWLSGSGSGDQYAVSGNVIFYGQVGRMAGAARDIVMLSKVNLADLTLGDKQLSGAGVQVMMDDLAQEQLILVTEDKQMVYGSGGRWSMELAVPHLSQVPSLPVTLRDGAGRLAVPGLEKVFLPVGPFPGMVALHDGASGLQAILQYDVNGNVTQAILSLSENFTALTVDNMKTYTRLVAGIDKVQWRTRDNVLFRLVKQTVADGSARQVLLIDHIDAPAGAVQPSLTLPGGNALGADMVVADVTGLVQSGPAKDNGLWVGANPAAATLLRYRTTQTLTAGALSSLKWVNEDDKRFTLLLPDGRKISTGNAASLKQFVLSLSDAQGNTLEGDFSAGVLTQAVLTLKQNFDSGLDTVRLSAQSDALSAGGGWLVVKTQDGVTFRFVRQTGGDGKPQLTAVVDAVDAVAYKAAHDPHVPGGTLPFGTTGPRLPGVDVLLADVTALVQASGLTEAIVAQLGLAQASRKATLVQLGTNLASRKAVYHYRTAQVMSAQTLGALRWQAGVFPDLWLLDLQDGNGVCVSRSVALAALTLVISDAKGSEWQINYDDAYTPPQMVQAVDAKGLSPFAVIQGLLTAVYDGDAVQKTGVSIDLSQPVQAGGESLAGVTQVSGSAYADVLSGNGQSVVLSGGGGNDVLSGGGVALLVGGAGADTYIVKPGNNVVISAQGNGTATDTLVFAEQDTGALSFALKDDDLVVSSADRVAVLKNWAKGDNHYRLSGSDGERDEAAFRSLVQDSLVLPGLLKALSAQYTALAQRNAAGAQVVTPIPLDAGKWQVTSVPHSGAFMPGPGGMGLNGPVVVTQVTGSAYDALADYRLVVTLEAGAFGLSGFTARLKAGGSVLTATATPVSGDSDQVTVTVEAKGGGQVVASGTLSVELEEGAGHGGVVVQAVKLDKLG